MSQVCVTDDDDSERKFQSYVTRCTFPFYLHASIAKTRAEDTALDIPALQDFSELNEKLVLLRRLGQKRGTDEDIDSALSKTTKGRARLSSGSAPHLSPHSATTMSEKEDDRERTDLVKHDITANPPARGRSIFMVRATFLSLDFFQAYCFQASVLLQPDQGPMQDGQWLFFSRNIG